MQQDLGNIRKFAKTLDRHDLDDVETGTEGPFVAGGAAQARPPVGAVRMRRRHLLLIASFVLGVVAPVAVLVWYMMAVATPQYASKVAFNVRSEEATAPAASLLGFKVDGSTVTDAEILNAFITSQTLVEQIDAALDIRASYARPTRDWMFAFDPSGSIESLVSYWNRMVSVAYKSDWGLIEVEVRAFAPSEAQAIAAAILRNSEDMINRLSRKAEEDATRYARAELDRAEAHLTETRQALNAYRAANQIVEPEALVAAQIALLNSLHQQLADTLVEYDLLQGVPAGTGPRMEQARRKIAVIETRIAEERRKLGNATADTADGARPFTEIVGRFEELRVDLDFAEQSYLSARMAYDRAVENARRNSRYLATYMPPTRAESAQYPDTPVIIGLTALFLFLIWAVLSLVVYSIRDRR